MKTTISAVLTAVAVAACFASASGASKAQFGPSEVAAITAPDAYGGAVFLKFDVPQLAVGQEVYYAEIQFRVANLDRLQEVELFEAATDWSADRPDAWVAPGGQVRGKRKGYWVTDDRTGDLVKFVVTESLSRFMSATESNHGFVVRIAGDDAQRLALPSENPVLTIYSGPRFGGSGE